MIWLLSSWDMASKRLPGQVSINFLRPSVEGDVLTAEATRVSDGKTMGLYRVTVRKEEKIIADFTGLAFKKT